MRFLLAVVILTLVVYALVDCVRTRSYDIKVMPKAVWVLVILVGFPPLGALAWLLAGRQRGPAQPPDRRGRPIAPDDDPDFLWNLEQQRRRGGSGGGGQGTGSGTGPTPA